MERKFAIDKCIARLNPRTGQHEHFWRVYHWAERPDAEGHAEDDQFHWHPESEHSSLEAAEKRLEELKAGAKKQSILITPNAKVGVTKH